MQKFETSAIRFPIGKAALAAELEATRSEKLRYVIAVKGAAIDVEPERAAA
jgi:hypothetical protein